MIYKFVRRAVSARTFAVAAALAVVSAAAPVYAAPLPLNTLTGTYTATLGANSHAALSDTGVLNLTDDAARSNFIRVDPQACSYCSTINVLLTVNFMNLTINGVNYGSLTETGRYYANYHNQTDSVIWTGATDRGLLSPFGTAQDGTDAFVLTALLGLFDLNLIDGADWNVQTYIALTDPSATPIPGALLLFGSGAGVFGLLMGGRKKRKAQAAA
jgi:hypothetical protein